ncbi:MAG TPA: arsenate reductase (glutaredoxin) [Flavobacteriia bacterium]|nr:arsenate reductase (glutaredoxin) [Flavobacteriia bacterium]
MKIYHNPRCSKSRQGLEILKNSGHEFEVVDYLHHPPSKKELKKVLKMLGLTPIQLVRKNEAIWKENYRNKELTDDAIIEAMCEHPKLIERPIVIKDNQAVLGRPPENIEKIL